MSGKRDDSGPIELSEDELSGGTIPTDPELEAALREAADAVPELAKPQAPAAAPAGDSELLLDDMVEADEDAELFRLREQVTDANDRLLRLQADFENFRKRAFKERQDALQYGHQNLVKDLLSVVDNLDRAIGHARQSEGGDLESFLQGVELVKRELLGVFETHHVTEIEALGESFDPSRHEAMAQVESDEAPPNAVVEVLEKGYQLRDRLVRPTRVIVAKASDGSGENGGGEADG